MHIRSAQSSLFQDRSNALKRANDVFFYSNIAQYKTKNQSPGTKYFSVLENQPRKAYPKVN